MRGAPCGFQAASGMTLAARPPPAPSDDLRRRGRSPPAVTAFEDVAPGRQRRRRPAARTDRALRHAVRDVAAALRPRLRARASASRSAAGGHAPGGFAVADGALVIDVSAMRAVYVDPARRRAAGAGRSDLARARRRRAEPRARGDGRAAPVRRRRGLRARLRLGLAGAQARPGIRPHASSPRAWSPPTADVVTGERGRAPRPALGAARRRRRASGSSSSSSSRCIPSDRRFTGGLLTLAGGSAPPRSAHAYAALMADAPDGPGRRADAHRFSPRRP